MVYHVTDYAHLNYFLCSSVVLFKKELCPEMPRELRNMLSSCFKGTVLQMLKS